MMKYRKIGRLHQVLDKGSKVIAEFDTKEAAYDMISGKTAKPVVKEPVAKPTAPEKDLPKTIAPAVEATPAPAKKYTSNKYTNKKANK